MENPESGKGNAQINITQNRSSIERVLFSPYSSMSFGVGAAIAAEFIYPDNANFIRDAAFGTLGFTIFQCLLGLLSSSKFARNIREDS